MVDELLAAVDEARAADEAARARHADVKELLVRVRREKPALTLAEIEEKIGRYYDRGTISRVTAPALGLSKQPAQS